MDERLETGSYILRSLIKNVALVADGEAQGVSITCVELFGSWGHGTRKSGY
jgi:hypothetical protein